MKVSVSLGKYVIAVSGGVDSVALLDMLSKLPELELIVAHFDHGIRQDSAEDRKFVESLAKGYNLAFEYAEGRLGHSASEATARARRYEFLRAVQQKYHADAIVTAHHQDDLLETAIINLLRGTGRRGLSSLKSTPAIVRPLLNYPKESLIEYAKDNNLSWREDPTNADEAYLRNYVRHQIVARLSGADRRQLLALVQKAGDTNRKIETQLEQFLKAQSQPTRLNRKWFTALPHDVAKEIMLTWLRSRGIAITSHRRTEQLTVAAKTYQIGSQLDVDASYIIMVGKEYLALNPRDR